MFSSVLKREAAQDLRTMQQSILMKASKETKHDFLKTMVLTALLVGTIGSLYFMFKIGGNQKSIILVGLFTAWVTSPFVGLFVALRLTKHWIGKIPAWFYSTVLLLTVVSLTAYSGVLTPPQTKPAFNFLVVPLLSWLVILTILFFSRRQILK